MDKSIGRQNYEEVYFAWKSRENIKGTIDQMYENLKEMDNALVEDDIVYIDMLIENLEDNIEDLKEVVREIE